MSEPSEAERNLRQEIRWAQLPEPVLEHRFNPLRRWRFDLAWPDRALAVEVEGGAFTGGRHTRGEDFRRDCEKYNTAVLAGWRVLRVTPAQITSGEAIAWITTGLMTAGVIR